MRSSKDCQAVDSIIHHWQNMVYNRIVKNNKGNKKECAQARKELAQLRAYQVSLFKQGREKDI